MSTFNVLAEELRRLTVDIERDLHGRASTDPATEKLQDEYRTARMRGLTSATWQSWLDAQLSRTATAWVLATTMIRFCEDNGLLDLSFATDTAEAADEAFYTARPDASAGDLIAHAVDRLCAHPTMALVFDRTTHPLWRMRPGHDACEALLAFWRRRTPDGSLVHDFTGTARSTWLLADLYSVTAQGAMKAYAQVRTPSFVVSLIHDLTLDPALAAHARDPAGLSGFRVIDPACGSGAFLLDAYERLFRWWSETRPEMSPWQRAARALRSVHGCDIDPCAVSVTRFRLLLAAMDSTGERRLEDVPDLPLVVATGDSLLYGRADPHALTTAGSDPADDVGEYGRRHGLLRPGTYHVVTTNPPYITVKDKALFTAYRDLYESCSGLYTLSVPFTELAFDLALPGETPGHVGLLTPNSFMKREFGRNLIERVLARVQISHVIDTSGAYIPGHGVPTAVLVGRNRVPDPRVPVHVVVGRRGEPTVPAVPAEGHVWRSLRELAFTAGAMSQWAESYLQEREQLSIFPWSLTASAARDLLRRMEAGERLSERVVRIGYAANTGSDDLFCATAHAFRRSGAEGSATVPVLTGSEVRDWSASPAFMAFHPRAGNVREPIDLRLLPGHHRRLWPYRTVLRKRKGAKKTAPWYDWHQVTSGWDTHPWSIVFPWVATHPHFSLLRGSAVPLNSAPVIKLSPSDTEDSHLELLGALNSSAVCFWLKQMSQSKGGPRVDQLRGGEAWERIYEFTSTRLLDLPLPSAFPGDEAKELDRLAAESRHVLGELSDTSTTITEQSLASARRRWSSIRSRMIAIHEELDWKTYTLYGLVSHGEELLAPSEDVPEVALGERAFEIALARRIAAGEARTDWFDRHGTAPVPDIPEHWPSTYREVVERRLKAIQENVWLSVLEQPEYKRRWSASPWDVIVREILRERLLNHCESPRLWWETSPRGRRPVARTVRELAELLLRDADFTELTARYAAHFASGRGALEILLELLTDEHVPQAAPLRYKASGLRKRQEWEELWEAQHQEDRRGEIDSGIGRELPPRFTSADFFRPSYWKQRGKFDIPNERFVSFGSAVSPLSPTTPIGWAGWNAHERAGAVLDLLEAESHAHEHRPESALPLLRALADLLPWVTADGDALSLGSPSDESPLRHVYEEHLLRRNLSAEEVNSWRPPAPRRGRPRRGS
ncbi:BREX-2 system adenine-specific DNA-methyltransferase PglX [Streptomyces sp. NBC_00882]|uniref:BREX-2 system adenine-specific DNA-methyltransferase PglX n=1 Tax=Streptomyces sp. NBC_00882 TaxID=2975856 RepID=UPI003864DA64|nr:BREX-2 system adenine-specific DNA-methyltransferase PglX [Streptomyces sp. NBC_00882]